MAATISSGRRKDGRGEGGWCGKVEHLMRCALLSVRCAVCGVRCARRTARLARECCEDRQPVGHTGGKARHGMRFHHLGRPAPSSTFFFAALSFARVTPYFFAMLRSPCTKARRSSMAETVRARVRARGTRTIKNWGARRNPKVRPSRADLSNGFEACPSLPPSDDNTGAAAGEHRRPNLDKPQEWRVGG